jgi:Flp pilus assembly protein TadD
MKKKCLLGIVCLCLCRLPAYGAASRETILRIQSYMEEGKFEAAEIAISAALKKDANDGGLYNLRGIVHAERNQLTEAESDFTQAVRLSPGLAGASLNLSRVAGLLSATDPQALTRARATLEKAVPARPKDPALLMELARIAEKQNDLTGALGYLAHARDLDPRSAPVHFFFGMVCIGLNLSVEAKASLQRAVDLDPDNPIYNYARGSVELDGRTGWEAIPYFKKYVTAHPDDPRGHFALGAAHFAGQDYESSAKEMNAIAGNRETTAGAEYYLGRIAKAEGDWEAASKHYARSIQADPKYAESHAGLGLACMHLGDMARARSEMDRALELNPESYISNSAMLVLLQKTKDPAAGRQAQKLRDLDSKRFEKQELMLRTVKVRKYDE